jgi:hypothetical protein
LSRRRTDYLERGTTNHSLCVQSFWHSKCSLCLHTSCRVREGSGLLVFSKTHAVLPMSEVRIYSRGVLLTLPAVTAVRMGTVRSHVSPHPTVWTSLEHMHQPTGSAPSSSRRTLFRNFGPRTVFPLRKPKRIFSHTNQRSVCLQETHLLLPHALHLRSYTTHRYHHPAGEGSTGGTAILVKDWIYCVPVNLRSLLQVINVRVHVPTLHVTGSTTTSSRPDEIAIRVTTIIHPSRGF